MSSDSWQDFLLLLGLVKHVGQAALAAVLPEIEEYF